LTHADFLFSNDGRANGFARRLRPILGADCDRHSAKLLSNLKEVASGKIDGRSKDQML
jgi:hypothetical protein